MRRYLKIAFLSIALAAAVFAGFALWALPHSLPPMPTLAGKIERGAFEHGGRTRTWIAYLPAKPATHPALVIALHGSMDTGNSVSGQGQVVPTICVNRVIGIYPVLPAAVRRVDADRRPLA